MFVENSQNIGLGEDIYYLRMWKKGREKMVRKRGQGKRSGRKILREREGRQNR
jgi:hypothetical protein